LVTVFLYAYIWVQGKLILILPSLMHFSSLAITGLSLDYIPVKIGCLLDRGVFAACKKKFFCVWICTYIICEQLQSSFASLEAMCFTLTK